MKTKNLTLKEALESGKPFKRSSICGEQIIRELKAARKVVEAAKEEALFWNEEFCDRYEHNKMLDARIELDSRLEKYAKATNKACK